MSSSSATVLLLLAVLSVAGAIPFTITVRMGLTLDACSSTDDCLGDRRCFNKNCFPTSLPFCGTTQDCEAGEICVFHILRDREGTFCISEGAAGALGLTESSGTDDPTVTPMESPEDLEPSPTAELGLEESPSPTPEPEVCIDAKALEHLDENQLVFKTHRTARVLCDMSGSCATKGHMVVWNGSAMMMRSYCDVVGCEERIIKVNSPRYSKGLRVPSNTDDLHFTAFAARYESRAEEGVLNAAVRLGL